jgi:pyruvate, orthophosphate dikinase
MRRSQQADCEELGVSAEEGRAARDVPARIQPDARPSRLPTGVTYPEILEMQVTAIVEAMIECRKKRIQAKPEIMIPSWARRTNLMLRELTSRPSTMSRKAKKFTGKLDIPIGTMIEVPRAALVADDIAEACRLLQLRHQRPDADHLRLQPRRRQHLPADYLEKEILPIGPVPDARSGRRGQAGLYRLRTRPRDEQEAQTRHLRRTRRRSGLRRFFHTIGLDYVSCSPFRVPIARLVAAQAVLEQK